jgi:tetratricopeptide (TPR) repeat protein
LETDISGLLEKILLENKEDRWIVLVAELVARYNSRAIDLILNAIKNDTLTKLDEYNIISTSNSPKWNSIALTYLQNGLIQDAVKIFELLITRELSNAATLNNFGVVLLRSGNRLRASEYFKKAYELDKKRGLIEAEKLPAYQNIKLINSSKDLIATLEVRPKPVYHNILFMDIISFSRPTWYGTIQMEKITFLRDITRTLLKNLGLTYKLVPHLWTGDGMALFFDDVEHPIKFAINIAEELKKYNERQEEDLKLHLRIGIHSGDSFPINDLHDGGNRCGPAINTARRVMDMGVSDHILCSYEYGNRLKNLYGYKYQSILNDCGSVQAKHGEVIYIYNVYNPDFGNHERPKYKTE